MRSESRKETAKSRVVARARMVVAADLGWLTGFPLAVEAGGVRWLVVPAQAVEKEQAVDREHLSRATWALHKLRGEHAVALPELVEDPEVWLASIGERLELLKRAVHQGEPLPELLAEPSLARGIREPLSRLAAGDPRLRPLLGALSWIDAGHAERLRASVAAVAGWGPGAALLASRLGERPALLLLLRLAGLAIEHGPERVEALAAGLFDARFHDIPLARGRDFVAQILAGCGRRRKAPLPEELPGSTLGRRLGAWVGELVPWSHRAQQKALGLFALATPVPLLERWEDWWRTTARLLRTARAFVAVPYDAKAGERLRSALGQHLESMPPELSARDLMAALGRLGTAGAGRADSLAAALALVPAAATAPGRCHLFLYWSSLGREEGLSSRTGPLLEGFARYLRLGLAGGGGWLKPWQEVSRRPGNYAAVEAELVDALLPRRTVLAAYEHLAAVTAAGGGLEPRPARRAVELFQLTGGRSELAGRLLSSLVERGMAETRYSPVAVRLALRLCEERPERFADVLAALDAQEERGDVPPTEWPEAVLAALGTGALGELVRETLAARQWARLLACGAKAVVLDAAGAAALPLPILAPAVAPGEDGAWIGRYPEPLHLVLHRLAAALPQAERKVERWLADDLPSAGRLAREIRALEERLEAGAASGEIGEERCGELATRLANLRARQAAPAAPSPARLDSLRVRLERAWGAAILDRWQAELDRALPAALGGLLGLAGPPLPPWLAEPLPSALLAAACRMRGQRRDLALRLFRLRAGPPPWDLRDAPENQRFVLGLPRLDWPVWIDGVGVETVTAANGRTLALALEDDPLEIFRMGAHFQTCLSPGGFNYFSVFANAADINKRVLYARDGKGQVVGRCLLALTAAGELVTFEAYCHDGGIDFERISADFADRLAARLGTRRVRYGRIPTLVAADWYDDGARDLGRLADPFDEGSPLRRRLGEVAPDEVVALLRRSLKPARLDEDMLERLLQLPELHQRPELVVPLLPLVADHPSLSAGSTVTAAHLGIEVGAAEPVRRLLLEPIASLVRRSWKQEGWADPRAVALLERLDPARLLALLRRSRPRGHGFLEETQGLRLEAAAAALTALHRPRQAAELWRRLATAPEVAASPEQRQRAEAALGAPASLRL